MWATKLTQQFLTESILVSILSIPYDSGIDSYRYRLSGIFAKPERVYQVINMKLRKDGNELAIIKDARQSSLTCPRSQLLASYGAFSLRPNYM
jgi:hypothetical protein